MVAFTISSKWLPITFTFTIAAFSGFYILGKKLRSVESKIRVLEATLKCSLDKCAAERQGRIRAQKALREALLQKKTGDSLDLTTYPLVPIATVQSCFSTRNGTPRQPLLVPLARACLIFDTARVPPASLEGLDEYSHIWIIFVFHLNTDLEKLWMEPSKSKFKAKVRVPRLKGEKKGVFATRSPHRPCPIGLTVAKIVAVQGNMILLSGVDLVDGTPVLDVKPYLPYCDSVNESSVPDWVKADSSLAMTSVTFVDVFDSSLEKCWKLAEKCTLYSSPAEMKRLIEQVLSWDIRSSIQRNRPHKSLLTVGNSEPGGLSLRVERHDDNESRYPSDTQDDPSIIVYHLILELLDISYRIDFEGNVLVDDVGFVSSIQKTNRSQCNYNVWKDKL
ncbi:hypothetical protein RND81_07G083000 [Saponaria officinalis]|uniref:TsaA-like domain-containing protein n=1 Tax=Saponaria officinalis TaxID=3572 RepID=A0AAW1JLC4_SAPOF